MDIDFQQLVSEDESISSDVEDELLEEADIYEYEGLPAELNLDELSDLSEDEDFIEEERVANELQQQMSREGKERESAMSAKLQLQFKQCLDTIKRPFQQAPVVEEPSPEPIATDLDGGADLIFSEEELLEPNTVLLMTSEHPADAPATCETRQIEVDSHHTAADDSPTNIQTTSTDTPAIPSKEYRHLTVVVPEMTPSPLPATREKWQKRTATPEMKKYIKSIRERQVRVGENNYKLWLPYDLRDLLVAKKSKKLAEGPYANRKLLIDEYRLRKERQQWNSLA